MVKRKNHANKSSASGNCSSAYHPSGLSLEQPRPPLIAYFYDLTAKNVILAVIMVLTFVICAAIISTIFLDPERRVDSGFKTLARDYYENIFYADLTTSENYSGDPAAALEQYQISGIASVTLRQLSLSDRTDQNLANYLLQYCDENKTLVTFYPEPPYEKNSYRAEYVYSCNF